MKNHLASRARRTKRPIWAVHFDRWMVLTNKFHVGKSIMRVCSPISRRHVDPVRTSERDEFRVARPRETSVTVARSCGKISWQREQRDILCKSTSRAATTRGNIVNRTSLTPFEWIMQQQRQRGVSRNPNLAEAGYVRLYCVRPYFAAGLSDWPFARNSLEYLIAVKMSNAEC